MSVLVKDLEMPETEYMDVRIFRDGTATIATGTKPYYRELKAEPVKHGKWIKADSQQYFRKHYPCFTCSECGYRKDSQKKWNYCPHCGARMDGERKEE